jgi:hypothetical protein
MSPLNQSTPSTRPSPQRSKGHHWTRRRSIPAGRRIRRPQSRARSPMRGTALPGRPPHPAPGACAPGGRKGRRAARVHFRPRWRVPVLRPRGRRGSAVDPAESNSPSLALWFVRLPCLAPGAAVCAPGAAVCRSPAESYPAWTRITHALPAPDAQTPSGLTSPSGGTMAGQVVMQGFVNRRIPSSSAGSSQPGSYVGERLCGQLGRRTSQAGGLGGGSSLRTPLGVIR